MSQAIDAGIPVICLERDILQPNYTTYVHSDNVAIGRMAGQFIVDYLAEKYGQPKGKIVAMRGLLGVEGEINRDKGAREIFQRGIRKLQDRGRSGCRLDSGQGQGPHDRESSRAAPNRRRLRAQRSHGRRRLSAARELNRDKEMIFVGVDGLGGPAGGIKKVIDGILAATFVYPLCVDRRSKSGTASSTTPPSRPRQRLHLWTRSVVAPGERTADVRQIHRSVTPNLT